MNRSHHNRQGGFYLTALTAVVSTIAFIFLLGYSTYYSKRESQSLFRNQQAYILDLKTRVEDAYAARLADVDSDAAFGAYRGYNSDNWFDYAGLTRKWGLKINVSDRLASNGVYYTVIALWLPTNRDSANPPTFDTASGTFSSCSLPAPCPDDRAFTVVSGLGLELAASQNAQKTLNNIAFKAQSYFKARNLTDPTHNISNNYFRPPFGGCAPTPDDIPCYDTYTPISSTPLGALIGLDSGMEKNPWNLDFEVLNGPAPANMVAPPFTMSIRTATPWAGIYYQILAVQPL